MSWGSPLQAAAYIVAAAGTGGTDKKGGMGTVKFEPDQTSSIPVNITLTMIELPRFDHIYFLLA
jgi:hypothetical protein